MTGTIPGDALRAALERAGMTQTELAQEIPVDPGQVNRWTKGRRVLQGRYAHRVAEILRQRGVTIDLPAGCRVFFASPMASLDPAVYGTARDQAALVYDKLRQIAGPVYWASASIRTADEYEAPSLASARNFRALRSPDCEAVVYLQLGPLASTSGTGAHVELGVAMERGLPVTVFAPSEDMLPFVLRGFAPVAGEVFRCRWRFYPVRDVVEAVRLLDIHGAELLGLPASVAA